MVFGVRCLVHWPEALVVRDTIRSSCSYHASSIQDTRLWVGRFLHAYDGHQCNKLW